jgi:Transposase DDE domain
VPCDERRLPTGHSVGALVPWPIRSTALTTAIHPTRRPRLGGATRSIETTRRSQLADAADYGYSAAHSRYFWGFRLHGLFALDGTPRALKLTSPKTPEREVCLQLLARLERDQPVTVIGDKGYAGSELEHAAAQLAATIIRPRRKDEPGSGPHLAPIRQRIESIFHTCKDLLTLERHGARTLHGLRERVLQRFLALTAAIALNHQLDRPTRSLIAYHA